MSWDLFHARVREESQNLKPGQHGINLLMLRVLGPLLQRSWDVDGETGNQPHDHLSTEGMGIDGIHGIHGIWMLEQWSVFHPKFITHSKKHFQSSTLHICLYIFDIVNIVLLKLLTLIGLWIRCHWSERQLGHKGSTQHCTQRGAEVVPPRAQKSAEMRRDAERRIVAVSVAISGKEKKGLVWLIWHLATICYMSLRFKQKGTMLCIVTALLCRPFFWLWDDWSFCIFCKGFHRTAIACHSNDWFGKFLDDIWWLRSANPRALCVSLLSRLGKETRPKIFEERTDGWIWSFSACHLFLMFTIGSFTSSKVSRLSMKLTECLGHTTGQATSLVQKSGVLLN